MTDNELNSILNKHALWAAGRPEGERADLRDADLRKADLCGVNLRKADLRRADLNGALLKAADFREADLSGANLRAAVLSDSDLTGANLDCADIYGAMLNKAVLNKATLRKANLRHALFSRADMRLADLSKSDLCYAVFEYANMSHSILWEAIIYYTDLNHADLRNATMSDADLKHVNMMSTNLFDAKLDYASLAVTNLYGADLRNTCFTGAKLIDVGISPEFYPGLADKIMPIACPDTGSFIGWKKCADDRIVKLEICEGAKRSSATGRKCRCDKAKVLSIESIDGKTRYPMAVSIEDPSFIYVNGMTVEENKFDEDRFNECSKGIHFFITRQEAVDSFNLRNKA